MSKRDRLRRQARRTPFIDPRPIILVLTEGAVTEKQYLDGFAAYLRNGRVKVEVVGGVGVPKTIVQTAKERKRAAQKRARREQDENLAYDQVWCVFDVDAHPNIPDAQQMARDNEVDVAISNPCIELWLWLHFAEQPGIQDRHTLQARMKEHVGDYDKHVRFADYQAGYDAAVTRAQQLDSRAAADNEDGRNPTTGMWRLTEEIRKHTGR